MCFFFAGTNFGLNPRVVIDGVMLPSTWVVSDALTHTLLSFRVPEGQGRGHTVHVHVANQTTLLDPVRVTLDYAPPTITSVFITSGAGVSSVLTGPTEVCTCAAWLCYDDV